MGRSWIRLKFNELIFSTRGIIPCVFLRLIVVDIFIMVIKVYTSRECGNTKIKRDQAYIMRILHIKKIEAEEIDLSDPNKKTEKDRMQEMLRVDENELKSLPPQIFNEDLPIGVFEAFEDAVEQDSLYSFLNMDIPAGEIEYLRKSDDAARRELSKVSVVLDEMTEELSNVK